MSAQRFLPGDQVLFRKAPDAAWTVLEYVDGPRLRFRLALDDQRLTCREDDWILKPEGWQDIPVAPSRFISTNWAMTAEEIHVAMDRPRDSVADAEFDAALKAWDRQHRQPLLEKLQMEVPA